MIAGVGIDLCGIRRMEKLLGYRGVPTITGH